MKSKLLSIFKFLATFFICFSLLSIHVQKLPSGNFSMEYSSVQAEEEDDASESGMMSMITMLVIGVVTWRLTDMCAKTAPDILIAAAAGALFIAGEASAVLGHSDQSDKGSNDYNITSNGDNEEAQTDAFRAQKEQAEASKSTGETKLLLQAAASVTFAAAAVMALSSAVTLESQAATCLLATQKSISATSKAKTQTTKLFDSSTITEELLSFSITDMKIARLACQNFVSACSAECAKLTVGAAICEAAGPPLMTSAATFQTSAMAIEESVKLINTNLLNTTERASINQLAAIQAAISAKVSINAVQESLKARMPSKMISTTINSEEVSYTTSLTTSTAEDTLAATQLELGNTSALSSIETHNTAISPLQLSISNATTANVACVSASTCLSGASNSQASHASALQSLNTTLAASKDAMTANKTAIAATGYAVTTCAALSATLETQVAMCEPGKTSSFSQVEPAPFNTSGKYLTGLLNPKIKKVESANHPAKLLNKFFDLTISLIMPLANAGIMQTLGLAGPLIGIAVTLSRSTSFEWDNLLASPGNRAMIWAGLGVASAAATLQTNSQIGEKEKEITELDGVIARLEGLDKEEQSKETSAPSKNNSNSNTINGEFSKPGAGGISVNDRLAQIDSGIENNSFSANEFPCLKSDKDGGCEKFASIPSLNADKTFDDTISSIGSISDSLSGSTNLSSSARLEAGKIASAKSAIDSRLRDGIKRYNRLRKSQGKIPINFTGQGNFLLNDLKSKIRKSIKKQGLSSSSISTNNNSAIKAARDARNALLKARRDLLKKRTSIRYKGTGAKTNRKKRYPTSIKSINNQGESLGNRASQNHHSSKRNIQLNEISEDTGTTLFGLITNRYNKLKLKKRFVD